MGPLEMSNEFDVYYNSIASNQAPGLDEYEKSVFLTAAQEEITLAYFNPAKNKTMEGFDANAIRLADFSKSIRTYDYFISDPPEGNLDKRDNVISITIPDDVLLILNEFVEVYRGGKDKTLVVVNIPFDSYSKLMSKPFARPLKNQAWKLISHIKSDGTSVDLIPGPNDDISSYHLRYVKRPDPIILESLVNTDLEINGKTAQMGCELDEILHRDIVKRAVELAKAAYLGDLGSQLAIGNASQTDIGVVPRQS